MVNLHVMTKPANQIFVEWNSRSAGQLPHRESACAGPEVQDGGGIDSGSEKNSLENRPQGLKTSMAWQRAAATFLAFMKQVFFLPLCNKTNAVIPPPRPVRDSL